MRQTMMWVVVATMVSGCGYNPMVSMREDVDAKWAQVQNQLQRRNDLIPNLVETAKGYAQHEKDVFEAVANARSRLLAAGTGPTNRDEQIDAANQVSGALGRLLALSEKYPDLKANEQFNRLSDELSGTENRIATERMRYNEVVKDYNAFIKGLPRALYAGWLGFTPQKYFEASTEAQQVPKVDFNKK